MYSPYNDQYSQYSLYDSNTLYGNQSSTPITIKEEQIIQETKIETELTLNR